MQVDHSTALAAAMQISGALGAALVDGTSGMALQTVGASVDFDLELAAASNSTIMRATRTAMRDLGMPTSVEDILITVAGQYHIIHPLAHHEGLFLYLVLDRTRANLAMARFRTAEMGSALVM